MDASGSSASDSSMSLPASSSKRLIFDRRYRWIYDGWKEPSKEALACGRGMVLHMFRVFTIRGDWIGTAICLVIGCYLLQEHIRALGGFRNSFTQKHGVSNSVGIILLLIYPAWFLIVHIP